MTFDEFIRTDKLTDDQRSDILGKTIQTLLDVNYPGIKLEKLSNEHIEQLTKYVADNYNFRFINSNIMNSVVAEPK